jgi:small subunit ribosomal protein S13
MPRIAGIDIPEQKKTRYSLQYIFGVGPKVADEVLKVSNVDGDKRARDLSGEEINRLQRALEKHAVEGDLRRMINENIARLKRVKAYRGLRHIAGLPARGQRTRVNARTRRGKRRTVGAMSKELAAKLDAAKTTK